MTADYLQGRARASFMGIQGTAMALSGVVFVTTGGVLAEVGWRVPFLVYLAAIPALPMAMLIIVEPRRAKTAAPRSEGVAVR